MVEGENDRCLGQPQFPQLFLGGVVMRIKWETCKQQSIREFPPGVLSPSASVFLFALGTSSSHLFWTRVLVLTVFLCRDPALVIAQR